MARKLALVVNPCAGQRKATKNLAEIIRMFSDYGWETTVYITGGKDDALEWVSERAEDFERIVCAGGDGTLNEVFSGMLMSGCSRPIGYLSAGTTNDYAGTLGLSHDTVTAAHDVMVGVERAMDVGCLNGKYFAYTASFGAFTRTAYSTPQTVKNTLGHMAYVLEGIRDIPQIRSIHMRVETEDREIEDDFLFGAVNNSTSVGGILRLNADMVGMDDGYFEVLLVKYPQSLEQLSRIVLAVGRSDFNSDMFYFFKASKLHITSPEEVSWTRDGEYAPATADVRIEILHRAVRFIAPRTPHNEDEDEDGDDAK